MYCVNLYRQEGECSLGSYRLFEQAEANAEYEAIEYWGNDGFKETKTGYAKLDESECIEIEFRPTSLQERIVIIDRFNLNAHYPASLVPESYDEEY